MICHRAAERDSQLTTVQTLCSSLIMRTLLSSSTALLLPILAAAYDPTTGSSAQGNLSLHAPYNLNPSTFDEATSSPDTSGAFNITGYNISSTTPTPQSTTGWKLTARVTYDVSLNSSSFFEATTLYLETPTGMTMDDNTWKICAVVFTGAQGSGQTVDGTCNGVLSGSCFQALNVAGTGGSSGMDANGACGQFSVPEACAGDFPAGTGNVSAICKFLHLLIRHVMRHFSYAKPPRPQRSTKQSLTPTASMRLAAHSRRRGTRRRKPRRRRTYGP